MKFVDLAQSMELWALLQIIIYGDTAIGNRFTKGVPQANGEIMVEPVIESDECGRAVAYMASLPLDTNILNMTIMATNMPFVGRG